MARKGKLSRRSFMASVAGASATGGAMAIVTGSGRAQDNEMRDADSSDLVRPYTGQTDRDYGTQSDLAGYGQGRMTGITDTDSTDRAEYGRVERTGITDRDSGPKVDRAGSGRHAHTGITDSDSGPQSDRAGYGGQPPEICSDYDGAPAADPAGFGRNCEPVNQLETGFRPLPGQSPRR